MNYLFSFMLAVWILIVALQLRVAEDTQIAQANLSQAHSEAIMELQGKVIELYMWVGDLQAQMEQPQETTTIIVTPPVVEKDQKIFFRTGWCVGGSDGDVCGVETTPYYYHAEGGR